VVRLGKYLETFAANDIDIRTLPELNNADLQELGVSLGHRKIRGIAAVKLLPVQRDGSQKLASCTPRNRRPHSNSATKSSLADQ
jgi:hypothetical protein